jgi:hypothetical protein
VLTGSEVIDAYFRFMAAADKLGVSAGARRDVLAIATMAQQDGAAFCRYSDPAVFCLINVAAGCSAGPKPV